MSPHTEQQMCHFLCFYFQYKADIRVFKYTYKFIYKCDKQSLMQVAEHVNQNEKIPMTLKYNILKHLLPNKNIIPPNKPIVSFKLFAEYHLVSSWKLEKGVTPTSLVDNCSSSVSCRVLVTSSWFLPLTHHCS